MKSIDMFRLEGKLAMVTGGASGLGFYMALALAEAGADIALTSRNRQKAEDAAIRIEQSTGKKASALALDVTDEEQVRETIKRVLSEHNRLDVLLNNAGNVKNSAPLEERSIEDWQHTLDVNLTGTFLCTKHAAALYMMGEKSGNIINIASTAGMIGKDRRVYKGTDIVGVTMDYTASKGGVIAMTRDMAAYLAPFGIRVNCISPAGFLRGQPEPFVRAYSDTIMMGRMGIEEKELKGAAVFLASEASSFITAHNLVVDGGLTQW